MIWYGIASLVRYVILNGVKRHGMVWHIVWYGGMVWCKVGGVLTSISMLLFSLFCVV